MKKLLRLTCLMASGVWIALSPQEAKASHAQGSDITYENVAPNVYVVRYKLYRDCTGIATATSETLTYRAPGCDATSRTISMPRLGTPVVGDPYCAGIVAPCTGSSSPLANFEESTYSATITLPSLCENWILSARIGNRPSSRNLANGQGAWLFSEALINNVATQTNNSPTFGNIPIPFVCWKREMIFNQNVTDIDGDSIVYSLAPGLNDLNQPVVYGNYTGVGTAGGPYPAGPIDPATGQPTYPSGVFSATNPIISRNPLQLDQVTGTMVFEPMDFKGPGFPANQGLDKYVVAVQVDEYRKINGVATKIGHVRRDILVIVVDCQDNDLPALDSLIVPGGVTVGPTTLVEVEACSTAVVRIRTKDPNPQDILRITSNVLQVLPRATWTVTGGARPVGTITWTPSMADVSPNTYKVNVTIRDNACPIPSFRTQTIEIRVVKHNFARATASSDTICAGNSTMITAITSRPDSIPNFQSGIKEPAIYSYRWDPAPGLDDADTTRANPVVRPTQTTRYNVRIFSPDPYSCFDTASVLVNVVGTPQLDTVVADQYVLFPCESTMLTAVADTANGPSGPFFYEWSPAAGLDDSTSRTPIATPGIAGTHTYSVRVFNAQGCEMTGSVTLTVETPVLPADSVFAEQTTLFTCESTRLFAPLPNFGGPAGPYFYEWSPAAGLDDSTSRTPIATPGIAGMHTYNVRVFNAEGCEMFGSVTLTVEEATLDTVTADNPFLCPGETTRLVAPVASASGPAGPYIYSWSPAAGLDDPNSRTPIARPTAGMDHIYTVRVLTVEGCELFGSVTVSVGDSIVPSFTYDPIESSSPVEVSFRNTSTNRSAINRYLWDFGNGNTSTDENPTFTFDRPGEHRITLTVFDELEGDASKVCSQTFSDVIRVPEFNIPNIITPNGDGLNDKLIVRGLRQGSSMKIYNRWGSLVKEFKTYDNNNGWGAEGASDGIYYYIVKDNNGKETKGWVEVVRQ